MWRQDSCIPSITSELFPSTTLPWVAGGLSQPQTVTWTTPLVPLIDVAPLTFLSHGFGKKKQGSVVLLHSAGFKD